MLRNSGLRSAVPHAAGLRRRTLDALQGEGSWKGFGVLWLLETASFFQGTNYIFYSFSLKKGMVLEL